jgi:hypothetical protein
MKANNSQSFLMTNFRLYYEIAKESHESMNYHLETHRRPKQNGEDGWILSPDPERKSFKAAFIAIVFSGMFLEALLHLLIVERKGLEVFDEYDWKKYEDKFELLDCKDPEIMKLSKELREARKEIVHEKAHLNRDTFNVAQINAKNAIILIDKVIAYFNFNVGREDSTD